MEQLLETGSVSRQLGLSTERVRQLADDGVLPVTARTLTGRRLFKAEDVDRLQRERRLLPSGGWRREALKA